MKILVVDDDPDARTLSARALAQEFPDAELALAGGPAALEPLLEQCFDLLVTDLALRWSDGFGVFDAVRAVSPDCCCIMFTGTGSEDLAVRAMKAGFDDYLVKSPNQLRRLAAAARAAYERRSERRRLERHRELLLGELYHRLHNNLQIVISLVSRTAKAMRDPADAEKLRDLSGRIQAIAMLQEAFYRVDRIDAVPFDAYLAQLAREHAGGARHIDVQLRLEPVVVSIQRAVPLALIANELLTNSIKHGFPHDKPGRVELSLSPRGEQALLHVADNGVGDRAAPGPPPHLGLELMKGLARQIDAELREEPTAAGWSTTVLFTP